jgi:hypothetical protein
LLLYMHHYHQEHPWRLRIFPAAARLIQPRASAPVGVSFALDW